MKKFPGILIVFLTALFMISSANAFWGPFNLSNGPGWGGYNSPWNGGGPWNRGGYPGGYSAPWSTGYPVYGYPGAYGGYPGYGGAYPAYGYPGYGGGYYPGYGAPYGQRVPMIVPAN